MSASRPFSAEFSEQFDVLPAAPPSWPSLSDLSDFCRGADMADPALDISLRAAIAYGQKVLGSFDVNASVFQGCLDYAASLYAKRTTGQDEYTDPIQGSTPQQRYRRLLLAARPVAFA